MTPWCRWSAGPHIYMRPGEWARVPCQKPSGDRRLGNTFCWIKLLSLDPALGSARVYFNALYSNEVYPLNLPDVDGGEGAALAGAAGRSLLQESWPGRPGIDLTTWSEQSERFVSFFGSALRIAAGRGDWDLILGYIPSIDEAGHALLLTEPSQPGYSVQQRDAFAAARRKVWQRVDRELASLPQVRRSRDDRRACVVSDHGMAPVHSRVDLDVLLRDKGVLTPGADGKPAAGTVAYSVPAGGVAFVYVDPAAADRERLIGDLKTFLAGWKDGGKRPIAQVLTRREAASLGLDHPDSGDLIVFAADGYTLGSEGSPRVPARPGDRSDHPARHARLSQYRATDGEHLHGGRRRPGARECGVVQATDVAGRVAQWLGIEKPRPTVE